MGARLLFIFFILTLSSTTYAQKIKMKNGIIYKDGSEFLSYEKKTNGTELIIYKLKTEEELFTAIFYPGSSETRADNYFKLIFADTGKTMEYSRTYWDKYLISWLLDQEVLSSSGELNSEKLDAFIQKYDEKILERSIQVR